jgi:hypothetical protein
MEDEAPIAPINEQPNEGHQQNAGFVANFFANLFSLFANNG